MSSSLDAFETLSSTLLRAVPGALGSGSTSGDGRELTAGVEGVQRLCKALVSAKYLAGAMEAWSEDLASDSLIHVYRCLTVVQRIVLPGAMVGD